MDIYKIFQDNQLLITGVLIGIATSFWMLIKTYIPSVFKGIKSLFVTSIVIDDRGQFFQWLDYYLATLQVSKKTRRLAVTETWVKDRDFPDIYLTIAPGYHLFWWNKICMFIHREKKDGDSKSGVAAYPRENFVLTLLTRNRAKVDEFVSVVVEAEMARFNAETNIYNYVVTMDGWKKRATIEKRDPRSIAFPDKDLVFEDVKKFLENGQWYTKRGIPYKRGYLFYGTPGTGKTTLVRALAGHYGLNIYTLPLTAKTFDDGLLGLYYHEIPKNSIILMEDIDAVFNHREKVKGIENGLTFSGLLNAVDGILTGNGHILVITTNNIGQLDPALIRPGRIDVKLEFRKIDKKHIIDMFKWHYDTDLIEELESKLDDNVALVPAEIQGMFLQNPDPKNAIKELLNK